MAQVGTGSQTFDVIEDNQNKRGCKDSAYSITGLKNGITMDRKTGKITVSTDRQIEQTELQVSVVVGNQTITSPAILVEVFDCSIGLKIASNIKVQVASPALNVNILETQPISKYCAVPEYDVKGLVIGISMPNAGVIQVSTIN